MKLSILLIGEPVAVTHLHHTLSYAVNQNTEGRLENEIVAATVDDEDQAPVPVRRLLRPGYCSLASLITTGRAWIRATRRRETTQNRAADKTQRDAMRHETVQYQVAQQDSSFR